MVLVLAPTRELAVQIQQECLRFGSSSKIKNTVVYGGVPKQQQVRLHVNASVLMHACVCICVCMCVCMCVCVCVCECRRA